MFIRPIPTFGSASMILSNHPIDHKICLKSHRDPIIIKSVSDKLGYDRCRALTALHAISGTDLSGSFYGEAKDVAWSAFQKAKLTQLLLYDQE